MVILGITDPNNDQLKAVSYNDGPLLILALAFSEKTAAEMQDRIEKNIVSASGITVSTFHSFCNELIRDFSLDMGINHGTRMISKEHSHVWGVKNIDSFNFEYITIPTAPSYLITSHLFKKYKSTIRAIHRAIATFHVNSAGCSP